MVEHPVVRRGLRVLGASFALAWVGIAMTVAPGSAAWVELSGNVADAGLFVAVFYVAFALGAGIGGRAMDRMGRRPVLVAAHVIAATGYLVAGLAYGASSLAGFAAGTLTIAFGAGVGNLTRVAAADLLPMAKRGRGVAVILVSATFGAIVGPILLVASGPLGALLGRDPLTLVWFIAPPLLVLAAVLVLIGPEPLTVARNLAHYHPDAPPAPPPPSASTIARPLPLRLIAVGFVVLATAQSAMASLMGVTGVAVGHAGHGVVVMGTLMALHFVGMFGLSMVVGRVADRVGRRVTILGGLGMLAAGAMVTAAVPGIVGFGLGLLVVGLGWSFAYLGGTVLVADVAPLERRARILGLADLVTFATAALASLLAGRWFALHGMSGLGFAAAAAVLVPIVLAFMLRERRPGDYGGLERPELPHPHAEAPP